MRPLARPAFFFGGVLLSCLLGGSAQAAQPEQRVETLNFSVPEWTDCSQFAGAGDGTISATGTLHRRVQVRAADDGSVKETRHVHFTGTLTGPGGTAAYEGSFRVVLEDPEGLFVRSGQSKFYLPGRTAPLVMAGRQLFIGDEVEVVTPHGGPEFSESAVCDAIG